MDEIVEVVSTVDTGDHSEEMVRPEVANHVLVGVAEVEVGIELRGDKAGAHELVRASN